MLSNFLLFTLGLLFALEASSFQESRLMIFPRQSIVHFPRTETERSKLYMGVTLTAAEKKRGTSIPASSINLVKNCVGAGVFSLSARVCAISPSVTTQLKAAGLIFTMALWSAYNFWAVGKTCEITGTSTYGDAWGKSVSESTRWIIQAVVTVAPIVSCLASSIVLTDILGLTFKSAGLSPAIYGNRNLVIALLSTLVLFPLCSLNDLSALKSVSAFGLGGQGLATVALAARLLDGSYAPGGTYSTVAKEVAKKSLNRMATLKGTSLVATVDPLKQWFVLASLLSYCFVTHYNAPRYYSELEDNTSPRFGKMATISYFFSGIIYVLTMVLGIAVFGVESKSFLLSSLSSADPFAIVARVAFGASVLASFPLIFLVMRNWFISQAQRLAPVLGTTRRMTAILLTGIALLCSRLKDIGQRKIFSLVSNP